MPAKPTYSELVDRLAKCFRLSYPDIAFDRAQAEKILREELADNLALEARADAAESDWQTAETELSRVRGLLQRAKEGWMDSIDYHHELGEAWGGNSVYPDKENCEENHACIGKADQDGIVDCVAMRVKVIDADELDKLLAPNFRESSELVPPGAESAEPGKLNNADKSGPSGDSTQPE
jgi:hypothetical protein